jgi:MoxR-like ATPase
LVAAMNPFDAIGTARISSAVYDRVCRLSVDYQDAPDEANIVRAALPQAGIDPAWLRRVVEVVRRTRVHPDVRIGSSVRGAIDTVAVAASLAKLRSAAVLDAAVGLDAALVALSGRLRLREGCNRSPEAIVTELWNEVFAEPDPADAAEGDSEGKAHAPTGANSGR